VIERVSPLASISYSVEPLDPGCRIVISALSHARSMPSLCAPISSRLLCVTLTGLICHANSLAVSKSGCSSDLPDCGFFRSATRAATKLTQRSPPAFFSAAQNHEPVISLDGIWRFHPVTIRYGRRPISDSSEQPVSANCPSFDCRRCSSIRTIR